MAIDGLTTWQSTFETLPKVGDAFWSMNFASWVDERVTSKMDLDGVFYPSGTALSFTFNKSTFAGQLSSLPKTANKLSGITGFADAWVTAINASTVNTQVNSYIGSSTPATTWSQVNSTVIDTGSISAGRAKIIELASEPNVADGSSKFPEKFRDAFLLLTVTTDGLDSVSPPAGPNTLIDNSRAVK